MVLDSVLLLSSFWGFLLRCASSVLSLFLSLLLSLFLSLFLSFFVLFCATTQACCRARWVVYPAAAWLFTQVGPRVWEQQAAASD